MPEFLEPKFIIQTLGLLGVVGAVFAESGLLIGIFLPGDSLLFTAGFFASQGFFNLPALLVLSFFAAVTGDSVGYFLGKRFGPAIFNQRRFLTREHVVRAETFFARFGPRTIILARFVPIVRTLAPIMAGVAKMNYKTFFFYNILGGFLWVVGVTMLGFILGTFVPNGAEYLTPAIILVIIISFLPVIRDLYKAKIRNRATPASEDSANIV